MTQVNTKKAPSSTYEVGYGKDDERLAEHVRTTKTSPGLACVRCAG